MQDYPLLEDVALDRRALLDRAWMNLNDLTVHPDTYLYFYTALDLRFFIESLFIELLSGLKGSSLSARERAMYRAKDYVRLLASMDTPIETSSKSVFGASIERTEIDELIVIYGKLGAFLHLPKNPYFSESQEPWKEVTEELIANAYTFLCALNERLQGNSFSKLLKADEVSLRP